MSDAHTARTVRKATPTTSIRAQTEEVSDGTSPDELTPWLARFQEQNSRRERRRRVVRFVDRIAVVVAIIAVWQALVSFGIVDEFFVSSPALIAGDVAELLTSGSFYFDLRLTLQEALIGLASGAVAGTLLGVGLALYERGASALQPVLVAFNSLPRTALAPLFVVWLGFGPGSKILLAGFSVFFVIFFNAFAGVRQVDQVLVWNLEVLGVRRRTIIRHVFLPSAMTWVIAAMKTAISFALIAAVVGEFVGSQEGLGHELVNAISFLNTTRMFSVLVVLAVVGAALFSIVGMIERWLLRWR